LTLLSVLSIASIFLGAIDAMAQSPKKAKILLIAVYHFVSKDNEYTQEQDDPRSPRRQREISAALDALKRFAPTKIALELPYEDPQVLKDYSEYRKDKYLLKPSERDQFGFRLAKLLNHERVYPIDWHNDWDWNPVVKFAEQNGQGKLLADIRGRMQKVVDQLSHALRDGTVLEGLRVMNSKQWLQQRQAVEMLLVRIGRNDKNPGVELERNWYERNLRIFANLSRIIESPDDRILVLYGGGHVPLLEQFVRDSPDLELVAPERYLQ
jgi:hypothetical protein